MAENNRPGNPRQPVAAAGDLLAPASRPAPPDVQRLIDILDEPGGAVTTLLDGLTARGRKWLKAEDEAGRLARRWSGLGSHLRHARPAAGRPPDPALEIAAPSLYVWRRKRGPGGQAPAPNTGRDGRTRTSQAEPVRPAHRRGLPRAPRAGAGAAL